MDTPMPLNPSGEISSGPDRRYRRILSAGVSALLGKGTSVLVNIITVPLMVRYLGAESYGLWITISSAVTMFIVLDIGIANTLTNLISEAYAKDDRERAAANFATAFWMILTISAGLGLGGWLLWPYVHWGAVFHIQDPALVQETSRAVAATFVVLLFALPAGLASKVLAGYQELHVANMFAAAGSVLSLVVVVAGVYFKASLPFLVAGFAGSAVAANAACLIWIVLFHKPWMKPRPDRVDRDLIAPIFRSGTQFFAIQLSGLVVFSSDNLVISHYLSPAEVTPYAITWRLTSYILALQFLIFPALWPAYSEAYASGHMDWIRSTYKRVRWTTAAILVAGCGVMLLAGRDIIRFWAGPVAVPSMFLLELMCVWTVICAFATNQSCLMGATSRMKKQAYSSSLAAVVNLVLSILWVKTMGPSGVLLATIVSYMVFIVAVQTWEVRSILRGDGHRAAETSFNG